MGKNEPVSIAEEVPFEIPESWEWCRLGNICNVVSARRVHQSDWKTEGVPFYRAREIRKLAEVGSVDNELYISEELFSEFSKSGVPSPGDLMVTAVGTLGKTYIVQKGDRFYYKDASVLCFENFGYMLPEYLKMVMETPLLRNQIKTSSAGTTVGTITIVNASSFIIPVPPLDEQRRIVDKLDVISQFLLKYKTTEENLDLLNDNFPEQLKKSILQLAVQGKLVPQNPDDEPASVLLERIRTEKEQMIKEGKIKRDKNESFIFRRDNSHYEKHNGAEECIDADIPFDIPDSWCWSRLRTICYDMRYGTAKKSSKIGEVAVLRMGNIQHGEIDYSNLVYSDDPDDNKSLLLQNKDILFNRTNSRELVGKTGIYRGNVPAIYAGYLVLIRPIMVDPEYINYVMNSQYEWLYCQNVRSDGINQANVSASKIGEFLVPIPPLKEQVRIVQMLIRLLPLTSCKK